jgi:FkbM family methyltransferase
MIIRAERHLRLIKSGLVVSLLAATLLGIAHAADTDLVLTANASAAAFGIAALLGLVGALIGISAQIDPGARRIWLSIGVVAIVLVLEEVVLSTHETGQVFSPGVGELLGVSVLLATMWSLGRSWHRLPKAVSAMLLSAAGVLAISQAAFAASWITAGWAHDVLLIAAEFGEVSVALLGIWAVLRTAETYRDEPGSDEPSDGAATSLAGRRDRIGGLLSAMDGPRSQAQLMSGKLASALKGTPTAAQRPITLKAKEIGSITIRPRGTDAGLLTANLLEGHCMPPDLVRPESVHQICELGSNIGVGLAVMAARFPRARLVGVEAHPDNAALARRNLAALGDRCVLVERAVWTSGGDEVSLDSSEPGLHRVIGEGAAPGSSAGPLRASTTTVPALLAEHMPNGSVDFLHCDIVGIEPLIMTPDADWMNRVRSIKIQLYEDRGFTPAAALSTLRRFGFAAQIGATSYGEFAWGYRDRM